MGPHATQKRAGLRIEVRRARTRAFTLIELLVVVTILSVVAAITFAGIRQDKWEGHFREHTDDLAAIVTFARQTAVDNQTRTRLDIRSERVELWWEKPLEPNWDLNNPTPPGTADWVPLREVARDRIAGGVLGENDAVCIYGLYRGVIVDGGGADAVPNACVGAVQQLMFFPDGHMEWVTKDLLGAGVTLVVADNRGSTPVTTHIQVFPGGLIRTFDEVEP